MSRGSFRGRMRDGLPADPIRGKDITPRRMILLRRSHTRLRDKSPLWGMQWRERAKHGQGDLFAMREVVALGPVICFRRELGEHPAT